jgi:hypothetical protein
LPVLPGQGPLGARRRARYPGIQQHLPYAAAHHGKCALAIVSYLPFLLWVKIFLLTLPVMMWFSACSRSSGLGSSSAILTVFDLGKKGGRKAALRDPTSQGSVDRPLRKPKVKGEHALAIAAFHTLLRSAASLALLPAVGPRRLGSIARLVSV